VAPHEESRTLSFSPSEANQFSFKFAGLGCNSGVLIRSGFQLLRGDVRIFESFIGPGFGVDRISHVFVTSTNGGTLPAGDLVRMWVTCV